MRSFFRYVILVFLLSSFERFVDAQEVTLPAGTLLNCTLNEPDFDAHASVLLLREEKRILRLEGTRAR